MSFRSLVDRLGRPPEEIRRDNLRRWASSVADAIPISEADLRCRVTVAGVVHNIRIDPRAGRGSVEATIIDGTGELVVKWLGRSSLQGVRLGTGLVVEGIVGAGEREERVILNPEYQLVIGPEQG